MPLLDLLGDLIDLIMRAVKAFRRFAGLGKTHELGNTSQTSEKESDS